VDYDYYEEVVFVLLCGRRRQSALAGAVGWSAEQPSCREALFGSWKLEVSSFFFLSRSMIISI
jgi:hypothetical protein